MTIRIGASRVSLLMAPDRAAVADRREGHGPPKKRSASAAAEARLRCRPTPLEWRVRPAWSRRTQTYHGVRWTGRTSYQASFWRRQKSRSRSSRSIHPAVPTSAAGLATGGAGVRSPSVVTLEPLMTSARGRETPAGPRPPSCTGGYTGEPPQRLSTRFAPGEPGYLGSLGDGAIAFQRPDGRPLPEVPAAPDWDGNALAPVDRRLAAAGMGIDAETAPRWRGEQTRGPRSRGAPGPRPAAEAVGAGHPGARAPAAPGHAAADGVSRDDPPATFGRGRRCRPCRTTRGGRAWANNRRTDGRRRRVRQALLPAIAALALAAGPAAAQHEVPDTGGRVYGLVGGAFGDGTYVATGAGAGLRLARHVGLDLEWTHVTSGTGAGGGGPWFGGYPPLGVVGDDLYHSISFEDQGRDVTTFRTKLTVEFPIADGLLFPTSPAEAASAA